MSAQQQLVLDLLEGSASIGVTLQEVQDATGAGTIEAVGVLWDLTREGRIVRLTEQRRGFPVYVLPGDVRGREIARGQAQGISRG